MDTYADDLAELVTALDLTNAVHVGHSTGGGEVARYIGRHGTKRVAKAVLISAIPPVMLKSASILAAHRSRRSTSSEPPSSPDRPQFWTTRLAVLRLQPSRSKDLRRCTRVLLVAKHTGGNAGVILLHQGVL